MICMKVTTFCDLRDDLRIRLATHCKSVRKFWFCKLALTCVDLRVRLARALKVFKGNYIQPMEFFGLRCTVQQWQTELEKFCLPRLCFVIDMLSMNCGNLNHKTSESSLFTKRLKISRSLNCKSVDTCSSLNINLYSLWFSSENNCVFINTAKQRGTHNLNKRPWHLWIKLVLKYWSELRVNIRED